MRTQKVGCASEFMLAEIFTQLKLNILNIAKKDGKNRNVLLMQGNVTLLRTSRLMVLMVN